MTKHTPGPWSLGRCAPEDDASMLWHITAPDRRVAMLAGHEVGVRERPGSRPYAFTALGAEGVANGHLIAAAPELLAVLLDVAAMLPVAGRLHPQDMATLQTRVVEAIAKAKGVQA